MTTPADPTVPPVRIEPVQSIATKAKQALMIAGQELEALVYRQPYHLGHQEQRDDLLETLRSEFGRTATLPPIELSSRLVVYLVVAAGPPVKGTRKPVGEPILIPEVEVLPWVFAYVFGKLGRAAAERVGYRAEMLTTPAP